MEGTYSLTQSEISLLNQADEVISICLGISHNYGYTHITLPLDKQESYPTSAYSVRLNLRPQYSAHWAPSVRELIQNCYDQCIALSASGSHVRTQYVAHNNGASSWLFFSIPAAQPSSQSVTFLGILHISIPFPHPHTRGPASDFFFINFGTQTTTAILDMGQSNKDKDGRLAGHFGEGLKVQLNQLVANGSTVVMRTGSQIWSFDHRKNAVTPRNVSDDTTGVLHLHVTPYPQTAWHDVFVECVGALPLKNFDPTHFLFLPMTCLFDPQPPRYASPVQSDVNFPSGLEILVQPQHASRIYFHGIFVCIEPALGHLGLNYVGSAQAYGAFGFGRDRNYANATRLISLVSSVFYSVMKSDPSGASAAPLADLLWNEIEFSPFTTQQQDPNQPRPMKFPADSVRLMDYLGAPMYAWLSGEAFPLDEEAMQSLYSRWMPVFADAMLRSFFARWGADAIPVKHGQLAKLQGDADALEVRLIPVTRTMMRILKHSKYLPTTETLWKTKEAQLLSIPPYIFTSAEEFNFASDLVGIMSRVFDIHPDRFAFKAIDPKPTNPRARVLYACGGGFILDMHELDIHRVHARLATLGDPANRIVCTGNCNFACIRNAVARDMIEVLCRGDEQERLRLVWQLNDRLLHTVAPGSLNLSAPPSKPDPLSLSAISMGALVPFPSSPMQMTPRPSSPFRTHPSNPASPHGSPPRTPPRTATTTEMVHQSNSLVRDSIYAGSLVTAVLLLKAPKTNPPSTFQTDPEEDEDDDADVSNLTAYIFNYTPPNNPHTTMPIPYCIPTDTAVSVKARMGMYGQRAVDSLVTFWYGVVLRLGEDVFSLPRTSLHVFFEECPTVAFNRVGQLFFNLYTFMRNNQSLDESTLFHWYTVFCHEIGHNRGNLSHGKVHGNATEGLIVSAYGKFRDMVGRGLYLKDF